MQQQTMNLSALGTVSAAASTVIEQSVTSPGPFTCTCTCALVR